MAAGGAPVADIPRELQSLIVMRMGRAYFVAARCVCRAWDAAVRAYHRREAEEAKTRPWLCSTKTDRQLRLAHMSEWARQKHARLFGWAADHGLLDDVDVDAQATICRKALACGRGDLVRQLVTGRGYTPTSGLTSAAVKNGDTRLLAWLQFAHGCPVTDTTLCNAVWRRDFDIVQWCLDHGAQRGPNTLMRAAQQEESAVLQVLFNERGGHAALCRMDTTIAIVEALMEGQLENAAWLLGQKQPCDRAVIAPWIVKCVKEDKACIAALDLLRRSAPFCGRAARCAAIAKRRPLVMAWLCEHLRLADESAQSPLSAEGWVDLAQPAGVRSGSSLPGDSLAHGLEDAVIASVESFRAALPCAVPFSVCLEYMDDDCPAVVAWFRAGGGVLDHNAGRAAIERGRPNILREMVAQGLVLTPDVIVAAAERGDVAARVQACPAGCGARRKRKRG